MSSKLRSNRIKIALWIAVVEGLLTVVGVIPRWFVFILAAIAVLFWATAGRNYKSMLGRQLAWIFATSQAAAVLVPVVWYIAKWAAITVIVVVAAVALFYLFMERDHHEQQAGQPE